MSQPKTDSNGIAIRERNETETESFPIVDEEDDLVGAATRSDVHGNKAESAKKTNRYQSGNEA